MNLILHTALVAALGFGAGLVAGWFVWGRRGAPFAPGPAGLRDLDKELARLKAQIDAAESDADKALAGDLEALDQAVKRANGRLKLLQKSLEADDAPAPDPAPDPDPDPAPGRDQAPAPDEKA